MCVSILFIGQLLINGAVFSDNASHVIADSYQKVCGIQRKKNAESRSCFVPFSPDLFLFGLFCPFFRVIFKNNPR